MWGIWGQFVSAEQEVEPTFYLLWKIPVLQLNTILDIWRGRIRADLFKFIKGKVVEGKGFWGKNQMISKVIMIHPLGTMTVCTKFQANPLNSCWDISPWAKVVDQPTGQLTLLFIEPYCYAPPITQPNFPGHCKHLFDPARHTLFCFIIILGMWH